MWVNRQVKNELLHLEISRPPVNALNQELLDDLSDALNGAGDCSGVVISGREGMFSAGLDLRELVQLGRGPMLQFWKSFYQVLSKLANCPVPVVAAVTGHNPAGGTVLSLYADYRVAAVGDYRLGLNEVAVGLPVPPVVYNTYAKIVGHRNALQSVIRGRLMSPDEALNLGLVDELWPVNQVKSKATEWASQLVNLPAGAVRATKTTAMADVRAWFSGLTDQDYVHMVDTWFSPDVHRAVLEFTSKLG